MATTFFDKWLKSKYNSEAVFQPGLPAIVSSFSIPLNDVIYTVAETVYSYGQGFNKERAGLLKKAKAPHLEYEFFNALGNKILDLVTQVAPTDLLILSLDGVVPNAKINNLRQKAYMSLILPEKKIDINQFSIGTEFMNSLDNYLERWFLANQFALPPKVIYSSPRVPGDGIYKISQFMNSGEYSANIESTHVLYGLNTEVILAGLLSPLPNVYLIQQNVKSIVNIDNLKEAIAQDLGTITAVDDFVLLLTLLKNDYLPHTPALNNIMSLNDMFKAYKLLNKDEVKSLTTDGEIIWENFAEFINILAESEKTLLDLEQQISRKYPSEMLNYALTSTRIIGGGPTDISDVVEFDQDKFRNIWYQNALGPKDTSVASILLGYEPYEVNNDRIVEMIKEYMRGLAWVFTYYQKGLNGVNIVWYYPYQYAPLLVDLATVMKTIGEIDGYKGQDPQSVINPVHQLLAILPIQSAKLLPKEVVHLASADSLISDLYPTFFNVDRNGTDLDDEGIPLIPLADINRIIYAVNLTSRFSKIRATVFSIGDSVITVRDREEFESTQKLKQLQSGGDSATCEFRNPPRIRGKPMGEGNKIDYRPKSRIQRGRGDNRSRGRGDNRGRGRGRGESWQSKKFLM